METNDQNLDNKKHITVEELNIEILPVVYEIIRRFVAFLSQILF